MKNEPINSMTKIQCLHEGFTSRHPETKPLFELLRTALRENSREKLTDAINSIRLNCPLNLLYEFRRFCFIIILEEQYSEIKKDAISALSLPAKFTFPISVYDTRLVEENTKSEGSVVVSVDDITIDGSGNLSVSSNCRYEHNVTIHKKCEVWHEAIREPNQDEEESDVIPNELHRRTYKISKLKDFYFWQHIGVSDFKTENEKGA